MHQRKITCLAEHEWRINTIKLFVEKGRELVIKGADTMHQVGELFSIEIAKEIADSFLSIPHVDKRSFDGNFDVVMDIVMTTFSKALIIITTTNITNKGLVIDVVARRQIMIYELKWREHFDKCELECIETLNIVDRILNARMN